MWPQLLDLSREDSKRILRRLELEAYSGIISAFRAHGDLTKEKKKLLNDLQHILSISTERHRAEVRRAVNDEKLTTIADSVAGPNISSEWLIEGRRLIPLMPRLVPQTAFTGLANNMANIQADKNSAMLPPHATSTKEITTLGPASTDASTPTGVTPALPGHGAHLFRAHPHRPTSPNSNIVVLPSGMSIRIEGGLNTDEDEDIRPPTTSGKKRRRSSSMTSHLENLPMSVTPPAARHTMIPPLGHPPATNPMKITFAKSPQKTISAVSPAGAQKVILVSSASGQTPIASVLHRPSHSGAASTTTTSAADQPKTSIILPPSSQSMALTATSAPEGGHHGGPTFVSQNVMGKVRPRMVHRGRPAIHTSTRPGMVVPMSPQGQSPGQVQMRAGKPTIQVKHEGGMKIITHAVGGKLGTKSSPVVTRPGAGSQMVVVSNSSSISMVTKAVTGATGSAGLTRKVVNVSSQGAKLLTTARAGTPNVVTVNPKTLQITAVKTSTGSKPNVIVVQKAQPKHGAQRMTTTATTLDKVPDLVSFLQKEGTGKNERFQLATPQSGAVPSVVRLEKKTVNKPQLVDLGGKKFQIRTTDGDLSKSSVLAEIIQQANLASEAATAAANVASQQAAEPGPSAPPPQTHGLNEWVDYDVVTDDVTVQSGTSRDEDEFQDPNVAAIKSLLKLQQTPVQQPPPQPQQHHQQQQQQQQQQSQQQQAPQATRVNLKNLSSQITEGQFFNIDQASTVMSPSPSQGAPRPRMVGQSGNAVQFIQTASGQTRAVTTAGGQEVLGELDPQTGLFYPAQGKKEMIGPILSLVDKTGKGAPIDIFSSALAEAQIDLDPYQFMEEQEPEADVRAADVEEASRALEASASHSGPQFAVLPQNKGGEPEPEVTTTQAMTISVSVSETPAVAAPAADAAPPSAAPAPAQTPAPATSPYITVQPMQQEGAGAEAAVAAPAQPAPMVTDEHEPDSSAGNVSVAVQPVGLDPSLLNLEDFTSQRLDEPSSSAQYDESGAPLGKRKRRPPAALDDSPGHHPVVVGSWIRGAMNLIQRVSRYRGANREKGQINAADWFLHPVTATDAPDYYKVIETPMDLGTIRRKLETGHYSNLDEFHQDMCLIRQNCHQYNPPNHQVRKDCDEVFHYYIAEYEKLVDRLKSGSNIVSPPGKKAKVQTP